MPHGCPTAAVGDPLGCPWLGLASPGREGQGRGVLFVTQAECQATHEHMAGWFGEPPVPDVPKEELGLGRPVDEPGRPALQACVWNGALQGEDLSMLVSTCSGAEEAPVLPPPPSGRQPQTELLMEHRAGLPVTDALAGSGTR